jgi:hypothetical protein
MKGGHTRCMSIHDRGRTSARIQQVQPVAELRNTWKRCSTFSCSFFAGNENTTAAQGPSPCSCMVAQGPSVSFYTWGGGGTPIEKVGGGQKGRRGKKLGDRKFTGP